LTYLGTRVRNVGIKKSKLTDLLLRPELWLVLGLLAGAVTAALAFTSPPPWATLFGAVTAIIAIVLTYLIAKRQDTESSKLSRVVSRVDGTVERVDEAVRRVDETVGRVDNAVGKIDGAVVDIRELVGQSTEILRELAERDSAQDYDAVLLEPTDPVSTASEARPSYEEEAIEGLRAKRAQLDYENLRWQAKKPKPALPGNHGWFVESPESPNSGRWFVRKAKGMTVRKAMPREFLDALVREQQLDPQAIALDYQLKGHALAAWYARTYDGALYRVWRPNAAADKSIRTEKVED